MGWVCPICSSNNESDARACIVCGEARPENVLKSDIQSQVNRLNGNISSLFYGEYRKINPEEGYTAALELLKSDPTAGFRKMLECAERGYPPAQNAIGDCYYYGIGVPQDRATAYLWYKKAADQGHGDAINALKRLNKGE